MHTCFTFALCALTGQNNMKCILYELPSSSFVDMGMVVDTKCDRISFPIFEELDWHCTLCDELEGLLWVFEKMSDELE